MKTYTQWLGLIVVSGVLLLAGCPNPALMHGARTVGKGHHEITSAVAVVGLDTRYLGGEGEADLIAPTADIMYRGGVTDYFDIGVSLTGSGMLNLDLKFELMDTEYVSLALDPGVGGVFLGLGGIGAGYLQIQAPFMLDVHASDVVTISMAAKYSGFYSFASADSMSSDSFTHWMGGTFGLRFNITEEYGLMPYGGFMKPLAGLETGLDDITIWSAGLGFIYRM